MGKEFRRSKWFGIGGVIVVAVVVAAIALLFGSGANPTGALIAILAIVFSFVAALMWIQRRELDAAQAKAEREGLGGTPIAIDDPASAEPAALIRALAVRPVDSEAVAGQRAVWELARESMRPGPILLVLIALAVVPWQLFQEELSIYVFVPIIVGYALYLAGAAIGAGGLVDRGFEASAKAVAPLGLEMLEHPKVGLRRRLGQPGMDAELVGTWALAGRRHGRAVSIRREGDGPTTTSVGGSVPAFEIQSSGDALRAGDGSPAGAREVVDGLKRDGCWKRVTVAGGPDGITVERERDSGSDWLRDLWLAERLADRLAP